MKREMTRKGFTLVELLIVIVVIGILSAMMMLSSTEAVASAKANNIVSNLRNMKTAVLSYYADNMDLFAKTPTTKISTADVLPYLNSTKETVTETNNNTTTTKLEGYWVCNKGGTLYVACDLSNSYVAGGTESEGHKIRDKLAGRAKSTGLMFSSKVDQTTLTEPTDDVKSDTSYTKMFVVMWVR